MAGIWKHLETSLPVSRWAGMILTPAPSRTVAGQLEHVAFSCSLGFLPIWQPRVVGIQTWWSRGLQDEGPSEQEAGSHFMMQPRKTQWYVYWCEQSEAHSVRRGGDIDAHLSVGGESRKSQTIFKPPRRLGQHFIQQPGHLHQRHTPAGPCGAGTLPSVSAAFALSVYEQRVLQVQSVPLVPSKGGNFRWDLDGIKSHRISQCFPFGHSY